MRLCLVFHVTIQNIRIGLSSFNPVSNLVALHSVRGHFQNERAYGQCEGVGACLSVS